MSAEEVKSAYDNWQTVEKEYGGRHPKTLNFFAYYILVKHNNGEDCDSRIAEFTARLEDYKNWKNSDISFALAGVAYVLYSNDKSDSAYPLIRRAVVIAEYLSAQENFDAEFQWRIYVYVLNSLRLYKEEIPYDEKLYKYHLEKEGEHSKDVVYYLLRLDHACYCCSQYGKARKYAEKALELQQKYHAKDRATTLVCLSNLGYDLAETVPPEEEIRIREDELILTQALHGEDSEKGINAHEKLCKALLKHSSNSLNAPESLKSKARLEHYRLLRLKTKISGPFAPAVLKAKRDLITVLERTGQPGLALHYQQQLVFESGSQNDPPDFFFNRDRYHLAELYLKCGILNDAVIRAEKLLSELTAGLDRDEVMRQLKSKDPSLDIEGILMTRVFLQKLKNDPAAGTAARTM